MSAERVVHEVMDRWKAGIDAQNPDAVAAVFADDAVFQGMRPYVVGRAGVAAYYAAQPAGMTVTYEVLETRSPADHVVVSYLAATFRFVDREPLSLHVGVVLVQAGATWQVVQYQAAQVS